MSYILKLPIEIYRLKSKMLSSSTTLLYFIQVSLVLLRLRVPIDVLGLVIFNSIKDSHPLKIRVSSLSPEIVKD